MLAPIMKLLMYIGDAILNMLQNNFLSTSDILIEAKSDNYSNFNWWTFLGVVLAVIGFIVGICLAIPTGGVSLVGSVKCFAIGAAVCTVSGFAFTQFGSQFLDDLSGNFDIPIIQYTPYAIFSGQIPALDINFINPNPDKYETTQIVKKIDDKVNLQEAQNDSDVMRQAEENGYNPNNSIVTNFYYSAGARCEIFILDADENKTKKIDKIAQELGIESRVTKNTEYVSLSVNDTPEKIENLAKKLKEESLIVRDDIEHKIYEWDYNGDHWTLIDINAELTLARNGTTQHIGITNEEGVLEETTQESITKTYKSSAGILQDSIATWYKVLRTIALVGLLSVLLYVAIRILFTSIAADKAKYKKMLIDWVAAICILFILDISTKLTEIIIPHATNNLVMPLPANTTIKMDGEEKNLAEYAKSQNLSELYPNVKSIDSSDMVDADGRPQWVGDYVGFIRLKAGSSNSSTSVAYGLMYLVLVIYTCMFTFMYLKRVLYMAFLTMIAPLIALTYPLDKIKDGKAQAFSLWIREYIFNALIQPVHLILYTMVLSTVLDLAVEHPVYALVALGFFTTAERFIRKMFGFDSAGTVNALGQMAGGAAIMTAVNKLSRLNKRKKKDEDEEKEEKTRTKEQGGFGLNFAADGGNDAEGGNSPIPMPGGGQTPSSAEDASSAEDYDPRLTQDQREELEADGLRPGDQEYDQYLSDHGYTPRQRQTQQNNEPQETPTPPVRTQTARTNNSTDTQTQDNKPKHKHSIRRGMEKVGKRYRNKMLKAKPLRAIGKYTAMGVGGATLGAVGLAAGIATGDPSKALSYTAAGAGVGGALGKTTSENIMDEGKELKESFARGYQGEQEYNNRKLDKEYYEGEGFQEMLEQEDLYSDLSGKTRAKAMKKDIQDYRKSGITDNTQISTCMRAGLKPEEGVYAVQISKAMEKSGWNNNKIRGAYEQRTRDLLRGQGLSEDRINEIWNTVPKLLF